MMCRLCGTSDLCIHSGFGGWRQREFEPRPDTVAAGVRSHVVACSYCATLAPCPVHSETIPALPLGTEPPLRPAAYTRGYDAALADSLEAAEKVLEKASKKHWPSVLDALIDVRASLAGNRIGLGAYVVARDGE